MVGTGNGKEREKGRKEKEKRGDLSERLLDSPITTFYMYKPQRKNLFCEKFLCAVFF